MYKLNISSLCLHGLFDLTMNVSICVTSKTSDRMCNHSYTFVEVVSSEDVVVFFFGGFFGSQIIHFATVCLLFVIRLFSFMVFECCVLLVFGCETLCLS